MTRVRGTVDLLSIVDADAMMCGGRWQRFDSCSASSKMACDCRHVPSMCASRRIRKQLCDRLLVRRWLCSVQCEGVRSACHDDIKCSSSPLSNGRRQRVWWLTYVTTLRVPRSTQSVGKEPHRSARLLLPWLLPSCMKAYLAIAYFNVNLLCATV